MEIHDLLEKILKEYPKTEGRSVPSDLTKTVCKDSKGLFSELTDNGSPLLPKDIYKIDASVGKGNRAQVPWIAIFDKEITTKASKGYYLVYLFSGKGSQVYLSLMFSASDKNNSDSTLSKAREFVQNLDDKPQGIQIGDVELETTTSSGKGYERYTIASLKYEKGKVPDENKLTEDLKQMLGLYRKYKEFRKREKEDMNKNEMIQGIENYIRAKGFSYSEGMIENYFLSLKSKPFVILAGTSGTGKTRLVKLFAQAIGSTSENGRYKLVSVRPDWSDSTDLLGHLDLNGRFHAGEVTDFIKSACEDREHNYFLCLDEMNLARVEYYFSDFLSIMETKVRKEDGRLESSKIFPEPNAAFGNDEEAKAKYQDLVLPQNLFVVGTVNMDETTFPFSKKVLDRANTLEFSEVNLQCDWEESKGTLNPVDIQNELMPEYLILKDLEKEKDFVNGVIGTLEEINDVLKEAGLHFGYRVRDEISFYMVNNKTFDLLDKDSAMDNEIMQKILPRIQGNSDLIKSALCNLFKICAGDYSEINEETEVSKRMEKKIKQNQEVKYPKSAAKIAFMVERMENDGFTSYWL